MHIVSYRGPGMAGGVSAALARAWESNLGTGGKWWHIAECDLKVAAAPDAPAEQLARLPEEVIKGHYRFCNEFVWPIMHDLPEHSRYVADDHAYYNSFNQTVGWCILRAMTAGQPRDFFVQDYQLALLPAFLKDNAGFRSLVFWHIPWPKHVAPEHVKIVAELATGMLSASAIGFHTDEYAQNFINFVAEHLTQFSVSRDNLAVWSNAAQTNTGPRRLSVVGDGRRSSKQPTTKAHAQLTRIVVAPLGIDFTHWSQLASRSTLQQDWHPLLARTPFILSVDRADYTKGVIERIEAVNLFYERYPQWRGRITFAQICGRTRNGLENFESYWLECQRRYRALTDKYASENWQPLVWMESSYSSAELAGIYRAAEAMLITAVRDGLNLTAKEFIACQKEEHAGVLALSRGTGAWYELGKHTVNLDPQDPAQIAESMQQALTMDGHERAWRMAMLKQKVRANSLSGWWYKFSSLLLARPPEEQIQLLQETS